ncbi:MAG: serine hydrolase [Candidatus Eisenbacteria bacterium]|nr:serine hydrolase [Candidatus Eisenbacteria bacterium]
MTIRSKRRGFRHPWVFAAIMCAALPLSFPTASPAADDAAGGEPWRVAPPEELGVDPRPLERLREDLRVGRLQNMHSVVLIKDGTLVFEEYVEGFGRDRLQYTASISKSVGSVVFGIALDRDLLSGLDDGVLDMTLVELFPEYRSVIEEDPDKALITLHHVLSMTAGLEWDEESHPYSDPRNDWNRASRSDDPVRFVLERPVVAQPGSEFEYNGGLSILLSYLVEREAERKADEFARDVLFGPLGIQDLRWERLPSGLTDTDGGLHLRPRDLARLGQLMLDGGTWRDEKVVSDEWVEISTRRHVENRNSPDYGYQWWCGDLHHHGRADYCYLASGHGGQAVFVFPDFGIVLVVCQEVFENPMGSLNGLAILNRYVLPAVDPASRPAATVDLPSRFLDRYVGTYELGPVSLTVSRTEDRLDARGSDGTSTELVSLGGHVFRGTLLGLLDVRYEFEAGADGEIEQVVATFGFRESVMAKGR